MNLQHVNIKLFVDGQLSVELEQIINLFHVWVAEQAMDELLIDVADYRHVPQGPSVVLVGHEADYTFDHTGGRYGLAYNRKAAVAGDNQGRFQQALHSAAKACALLEQAFADLKFNRQEFQWSIRDRALAPQGEETIAACEPLLNEFLQQTLGITGATIEFDRDPRRLTSAQITLPAPFDLDQLAGPQLV